MNSIEKKMFTPIAILFFVIGIHGFSYNTVAKTTFVPKEIKNNNSYFGYSLVLRGGGYPLIIVGAPQDLYKKNSPVIEPGAIYTCKINLNTDRTIQSCTQNKLENGNEPVNTPSSHVYNMWLGMSMDGTAYNNGSVVACAPRWIHKPSNEKFYNANGKCFVYSNILDSSLPDSNLVPLNDLDKQTVKDPNNPDPDYSMSLFAYGEAGMSTKLSEDGTVLIIGAPGVFEWTGSVIKYILNPRTVGAITKTYVFNPMNRPEYERTSYLGYSVGIGKFFSDKDEMYAAGAPRALQSIGEVLVFEFPVLENKNLNIKARLAGKQMGEYFGSTIAAIDLNNDNLTDLLIGAPMHAIRNSDSWDLGRVYVYLNQDQGNFVEQDQSIIGEHSGARFGTSISNIGDINEDGFNDVAIGAPYEDDGKGAVYIYLGTAYGLNPVYVQRITIEGSSGFGMSISKGIDIDDNTCKDIAVGAYESKQVFLLRCHPSVNIIPKIETIPRELPLDVANFNASVCIEFQGPKITELDIELKVDSQYKRAELDDSKNAKFSLSGMNNIKCQDFLVNVKANGADFSRPIDLEIIYKLKKDPMLEKIFCKDCTVIRPVNKQQCKLEVPVASGCGADLVCNPDLKIRVEALTGIPFVIGSSPNIGLKVSLENTGEPAYLAEIQIKLPRKTPVARVPSNCQLSNQYPLLFCGFENPFPSNEKRVMVIEFGTSLLTSADKMMEYNITATSGGQEVTPEDNTQIIKMPLERIANIKASGTPDSIQYIDPNSTVKQEISLTHSFDVSNEGPTVVDTISLYFLSPVAYFDVILRRNITISNVYRPVVRSNDQTLRCSPLKGSYYRDSNTKLKQRNILSNVPQSFNMIMNIEDEVKELIDALPTMLIEEKVSTKSLDLNCTNQRVTCLVTKCVGTKLTPGSNGVFVSFQIDLNINNTEMLLEREYAMTISTYAIVESEYIPSGRSYIWARSIIVGSAAPIPRPIYYWLAGIIGLILLIVMIYVLYRFGFFKRKRAPKSEKEDVKAEPLNGNGAADDSS